MKRVLLRVVPVALVSLSAISCDRATAPTQTALPAASASVRAGGNTRVQSEALRTVMQGLARALSDSATRMSLYQAMEASPYLRNSVDVKRFLVNGDGRAIVAAAAGHLSMASAEFQKHVAALPPTAMYFASPTARLRWTGRGRVVVTGDDDPRAIQIGDRLVAYNDDGSTTTIDPAAPQVGPVLMLDRIRGGALKARRSIASAARLARPTALRGVAAPEAEEELVMLMSDPDCDPMDSTECCTEVTIYCDPGSTGEPPPLVLGPLYYSTAQCSPSQYNAVTATTDYDYDGIRDTCELELARAFEPWLLLHNTEIWKHREPHFVVRRVSDSNGYHIRIGYLLSYYYDGGSYSHDGDSEFIIIEVKHNGNGQWAAHYITTSAHRGAPLGFDETRRFAANAYSYAGVAPVIYVSKDHHANYNNHSRCNDRVGDACDGWNNALWERVGIRDNNNIGNADWPFILDPGNPMLFPDCTRSEVPFRTGIECYLNVLPSQQYGGWDGMIEDFAGWSNNESSRSDHYSDILWAYGLSAR